VKFLRPCVAGGALLLVAAAGAAQGSAQDRWTIGASYGLTNDVEGRFRLDAFTPRDISAWADYYLDNRTLLRASYVDITTKVDRPYQNPSPPPPEPLPTRPIGIHGVTLGVSYLASEGFFTSGIFGGIGGYHISPNPAPELAPYQDVKETVFGFHAGVDGDFRITRQFSAVVRLTFHGILSQTKRWLLSSSVGFAAHL
jgi:hypothetical protein